MAQLVYPGAQDGEGGGLAAALFFREQLRQRLQRAGEDAVRPVEALPVRVRREHRIEQAADDFPARVERTELDAAAAADDLQRRADRSNVPAGVALRVFVAGRQVRAPLRIEAAQQMREPALVRRFGRGSDDTNAARSAVGKLAHRRLRVLSE